MVPRISQSTAGCGRESKRSRPERKVKKKTPGKSAPRLSYDVSDQTCREVLANLVGNRTHHLGRELRIVRLGLAQPEVAGDEITAAFHDFVTECLTSDDSIRAPRRLHHENATRIGVDPDRSDAKFLASDNRGARSAERVEDELPSPSPPPGTPSPGCKSRMSPVCPGGRCRT